MKSKSFLAIMFAMVLMGAAVSVSTAAAPLKPSESLTLIDCDGTKTSMTLDDLRKMPQELEEQLICVGQSSGYIGIFDYSGVRLSNILEKAKASVKARDNKRENLYVVFKGTDGYQIIATWTELTMTSDGKRVLIALEKDSNPLSNEEGGMRLVLPGDKYVGRMDAVDPYTLKAAQELVSRCGKASDPEPDIPVARPFSVVVGGEAGRAFYEVAKDIKARRD